MKMFFLLSLVLLPQLTKPEPALAASDPPSVHGMLLFGKQKIFLSHLPMFHAPHNYQMLAEAELTPAASATYAASLKQHPEETVYTLVPERFSLPEMAAHPQPFQADLFRGHFERGGTLISEGLQIKLVRVLLFRKFVPGEAKPENASYLLLGNSQEQFLAHHITAKPDFDHILRVQAPASLAEMLEGKVLSLQQPGVPDTSPLSIPGEGSFELGNKKQPVKIALQKEIYLEFGDLAH